VEKTWRRSEVTKQFENKSDSIRHGTVVSLTVRRGKIVFLTTRMHLCEHL
jgi:hypothetical protein